MFFKMATENDVLPGKAIVLCGACKKSAVDRVVKCVKCPSVYHMSCAKRKFAGLDVDNDKTDFRCCGLETNLLDSRINDLYDLILKNHNETMTELQDLRKQLIVIKQENKLLREKQEGVCMCASTNASTTLDQGKCRVSGKVSAADAPVKKNTSYVSFSSKEKDKNKEGVSKMLEPVSNVTIDGASKEGNKDRVRGTVVTSDKPSKLCDNDQDTEMAPHVKLASEVDSTLGTGVLEHEIKEKWTEIVKKPRKKKNKVLHGTKTDNDQSGDLLKAGIIRKWIFVGKTKKGTKVNDVVEYITKNLPGIGEVICSDLQSKGFFESFRVGVDRSFADQILDPSFWPKNILIKDFLFRRKPGVSLT